VPAVALAGSAVDGSGSLAGCAYSFRPSKELSQPILTFSSTNDGSNHPSHDASCLISAVSRNNELVNSSDLLQRRIHHLAWNLSRVYWERVITTTLGLTRCQPRRGSMLYHFQPSSMGHNSTAVSPPGLLCPTAHVHGACAGFSPVVLVPSSLDLHPSIRPPSFHLLFILDTPQPGPVAGYGHHHREQIR
jgi:hypothetical protein